MGLLSRGEREGWDYYLEGRGRGGTTIRKGGPFNRKDEPRHVDGGSANEEGALPSPSLNPALLLGMLCPALRMSPGPRTTPIRKSHSIASQLEMEPVSPMDPVTDAYLKSKGHHDNLIQLLESSESYGVDKNDKVWTWGCGLVY